MNYQEESLRLHGQWKGKIEVVATVPVGYADGYSRCLSSRFYVLIRGQRAPILGRVCMDQLMLDVTAREGMQIGDEVTVFGTDPALTAEEMAAQNGTIQAANTEKGAKFTIKFYKQVI